MRFRYHHFTLLELAVVIVILILLTTVASVYIRSERKAHEFERSLRDFQVFCARARTATMQDGIMRKIVYYPDEQVFMIEKVERWNESAATVTADDAENNNTSYVVLDVIDPDAEEEDTAEAVTAAESNIDERYLTWKFPAKLGMNIDLPDLDGVEITEESLELWRYSPGGSARLQYGLKVRLNDDARLITVSDFTGLVEIVKDSGDEGHRVF